MSADPTPPVAKQVDHLLSIHGHERNDPWFWLRDDAREDAEVIAHLEAENAYTKAILEPTEALQTELFEEMKGRIKKDDSSVPVKIQSYWYYRRYEETKEYPIYCRRKGEMSAAEEVMLDVNEMAEGIEYFQVAGVTASHGEQHVAWAEDTVSRRIYTLRVKDLATGEVLPDRIEGTSGAVAWANDDQTLFYVRRDPTTLRAHAVYRHRLGTPQSEDVCVWDERDETFYVTVYKSKSRQYVMIYMHSTLVTETRYLDANDPQGAFRPVLPREPEHEYSVAHHGQTFYVRTNWEAKNFRLMAAPVVTCADKSTWLEVIGHRDEVLLASVDVFDDHLVLGERKDALRQLRVIRWEDRREHYVAFDEAIYVASASQNPEFNTTKLRLAYSSPVTPNSVYEYDLESREMTLLKQDEVLGGYDPGRYVTERRWAPARDGARIPISLVYLKGTPLDGSRPLYQYGYGSYGHSLDPWFSASRISLLDRGFIYAIAHVRGGQEMGRGWYEQGRQLDKRHTFEDFVDATEYLHAEGYGQPDRTVAAGGSAGGLLVGAVANMRPDLYEAIYAAVPFVDIVTTMLDESIPLTTGEYDEWGNPNKPEFYHYMLSYSPYDQVSAQDYPHIVVTTGFHDSQVQYFEPAKWVAKLRATKTDERLLLLDCDMDVGHGGASGRFKPFKKIALVYAALIWILGDKMPDLEGA